MKNDDYYGLIKILNFLENNKKLPNINQWWSTIKNKYDLKKDYITKYNTNYW